MKKTRVGGLLNLIGMLIFFMVWFFFLIGKALGELGESGDLFTILSGLDGWFKLFQLAMLESPFGLILIIVLLRVLPEFFKAIKISLLGEEFFFDGLSMTITRNGKQKLLFADVRSLVISTIVDTDSERPDTHRVSILSKSWSSLHITESGNYEQMAKLADDIARVLNCEVLKWSTTALHCWWPTPLRWAVSVVLAARG